VRGPQARELGVSVPRDRLNGWTLGNLNGYWKRTAEDAIATLRPHDSGEVIAASVVAWITLGPARLHYTLATGDIASKSAAGRYAIDTFPAIPLASSMPRPPTMASGARASTISPAAPRAQASA